MRTNPTHVGVELRLTVAEADAMNPFLQKLRRLIGSRVISCPPETREPLLSGLGRLLDRLAENQPPFDPP